MGKPIEIGIHTAELESDWVIAKKRVGQDSFIALVASKRGTHPVVVTRQRPSLTGLVLTSSRGGSGVWDKLSGSEYILAEKTPVDVYGGEGSFALTSHVILIADTDIEVRSINRALAGMMKSGVALARTLKKLA